VRFIALALFFAPAVALAQAAERNSFYLAVGKDTILAERVWRSATELRGEFVDRARGGRMEYVASLAPDGSITNATTRFLRPGGDTVGDRATFQIAGDQVLATMGSATAPARIPSVVGALLVVNPSVAFLEQMILRAKAMNAGPKVTVPLFILGAPQPVPATVTFVGTDSATLEYAGVTMRIAIAPDGRLLSGAATGGVTMHRGPAMEGLLAERKDYSAPANAPYTAEEVVIRTPSGVRLSGTLTLPKARITGRASAVVTITGSGPEDRDESAPTIRGYRPFRELADTLGRRGIAVLRLDDRGVGGSDPGPTTATSADYADDVRAAIAYLRSRDEIDGARIAIVGHSEGGMIAPMVAEADPRLRAIVLMASPGSRGRDILLSQQHYAVDTLAKLTGAARDDALARYRQNTDSLAARAPWMKWFLEHDPSAVARRVRTPVLILQGETDHQVPVPEAEKLASAFRAAGNPSVTVRLFPETNHLFVADKIGGFSYEKLPSLAVRKDVLGSIADWLSERFR
jgi:pimeloyl-ACP methyl ester carboxylesterase